MIILIEDDIRGDEHEATLIKITHNGYQWSSLRVYNLNEIKQIRDHLTSYIFSKEKIIEPKEKFEKWFLNE